MRFHDSYQSIAAFVRELMIATEWRAITVHVDMWLHRAGLTLVRRGLASIALLLTLTLPAAAEEINIALNKPVTPLTNAVRGEPKNMVDGSDSTFWDSYQSGDCRIFFPLDLGSATEFDAIRLQPLQCRNYTIKSSTDNLTWATRYSESFASADNSIREITIVTPCQARYLRYTATSSDNAYAGLVEFEVRVRTRVS